MIFTATVTRPHPPLGTLSMYTLIVSGAASEQDHGSFRMDRSRFLEYTDEAIKNQLRPLTVEAVQCLQSWPCVLMEEGRGDEVARVGRISQVSATSWEVTFIFEPISFQTLTNDELWKLSDALDIGDFEFSRNHVAIKNRDFFAALAAAGYEIDTAISSQFSEQPLPAPPRTELLRARDVISEWGHSEIDDLLLDIGSSALGIERGPGSRRDRANAIVRFALENPNATTAENSLLSAYLVRRTLGESPPVAERVPALAIREANPTSAADTATAVPSRSPNRVFVVHGQNEIARTDVVDYLRELGLEPIILHDQPNMGRHLLTKFIQEADLVTFAVVLMTDDDVGGPKDGKLAPRTRQNVILELGYFIAHLRMERVCALITPGLETPSDFDGIVYIRMDSVGVWRKELIRELRAARMPITSN